MKGSSPTRERWRFRTTESSPGPTSSAKLSLLGPKGAWPAGSGSAVSRLGIGSGLEGLFLYLVQ